MKRVYIQVCASPSECDVYSTWVTGPLPLRNDENKQINKQTTELLTPSVPSSLFLTFLIDRGAPE